ncbi:hypothetical protein [Robertmurraya sp.]|uniref:hypothetical protein n=1 Tax=Robertmurraya sp. TaxID=2837525 RepID=UPI0037036DD5
MNKYRIVEIRKDGYYKFYRVQERYLLFFWIEIGRAFDTIPQAESWLKDEKVRQVTTVVHEE